MWHSRYAAVARILGLLTMLFGTSLAVPLGVSLWLQDGEWYHLAASGAVILGVGFVLWFPSRSHRVELRNADSFLVVGFYWIVLGLLGALPFMLGPHLGFIDSLFEAVSGFTTTGATVIVGIDELPASILLYRQQLQWLGGAGVVVLAVAVLPWMGVGGMQLYRAEIPGPDKAEKLTPRIARTARYLWAIYVSLTVGCAIAYWLAGMSPFDAFAHALSTVSTGGFSTHDLSLGYYDSWTIELVAQVFMLAGAINFSVHFRALRDRNLMRYQSNAEVRSFLVIVAASVATTGAVLALEGFFPSVGTSLRNASFHVISVITTTGFTTSGFSAWPLALPVIYMFLSFIGGCAGSTAGGMKVVRSMLLWKQGAHELKVLIHPTLSAPIKLGGSTQDSRVVSAVWGFFSVYAFTFTVLMILMMMTGESQVTAFSAIATCMNNLGPGLGDVAATFNGINDAGKLIAVFAMLVGRLEVFTLIVLLTPAYWRR